MVVVMAGITGGDSSSLAGSSSSVSVEGEPWRQAIGTGVVAIMVAASLAVALKKWVNKNSCQTGLGISRDASAY